MSPETPPDKIDDIAYYHLLRSRLEHEDGLIVNRLAWLMASESFLFTAYAIVLNGTGTPQQRRLASLIPLVAIATSVLIFAGIVAAVRAMGWIRGLMRERIPDPSGRGLPPIHTPGSVRAGLAAPLLIPGMFVAVWLYLMVAWR